MTRANKALVVMVIAVLGLWGCAQGPANNSTALQERIKALEGKCTKLEDDYRAVASARDQLRKKLTTAEEERTRLLQELNLRQTVMKERDELRAQFGTTQTQLEQLRKGLKALLEPVEAAAPASTVPAASTTTDDNANRS